MEQMSDSTLPAPLVPADVDLRDFGFTDPNDPTFPNSLLSVTLNSFAGAGTLRFNGSAATLPFTATAGIDLLIPTYEDFDAACADLLQHSRRNCSNCSSSNNPEMGRVDRHGGPRGTGCNL